MTWELRWLKAAVWDGWVHQTSLAAAGRQDAVLEDVAFRLQQLTQIHSIPDVAFGDCLSSARRLGASRLLLTELGGKRLCMRLALNVPHDDVVDVLQSDDSAAWLKNLNLWGPVLGLGFLCSCGSDIVAAGVVIEMFWECELWLCAAVAPAS